MPPAPPRRPGTDHAQRRPGCAARRPGRHAPVAGLRGRHRVGERLARPHEPLGDEEWEALLAGVSSERLQGLLAGAIMAGDWPVSDAQREAAADQHRGAMVVALRLERLLLRTATLLREAGVPFRAIKGPAVAHLVYGDPSLRAYGDVDLVVPGESFDLAAGLLVGAGLERLWPELRPGFDRRFGKGTDFRGADGLEVDLHRTFVHGHYGMRVVTEDLFSTSATFELAGQPVPALDAENQLLCACYNAALSGREPRLSALRDIAQLCQPGGADQRVVMERAASWRGEAVVARAVTLTWARLALSTGCALSAWASDFRPSASDERRMRLYLRPGQSWGRLAIAAVGSVPGARDKVSYLTALLVPRRELLAQRGQRLSGRWRHGARLVTAPRRAR